MRFYRRLLRWALILTPLLPAIQAVAAPVRGVPGDYWADRVIGQVDFGQLTPNEPSSLQVLIPDGVYVDRSSSPQRLYVYDSGNSRILGFTDLNRALYRDWPANSSLCLGSDPAAAPLGADLVLGQPDFTHTACNGDSNFQDYPNPRQPNSSCLCTLSAEMLSPLEAGDGANMAVDAAGDLYVPDYFNNRVLRYDAPVTSSQAASYAWGQGPSLSNFTSGYNQCLSPSPTSLCFSTSPARVTGVAVDASGNLWVADSGNNRVVRFPAVGGVPQATADLVLGQSNLTSRTAASSLADTSHFSNPAAVRVDAAGDVYVLDDPSSTNPSVCLFHGRLLVYRAPITSGMAPSGVLTDYLSWSMGMEFDPPSGDLWVSDFCNHQIILFHVDLAATPVTFQPVKVLLRDRPSVDGTAPWPSSGDGAAFHYASGTTGSSFSIDRAWGGIGVDASGNVYVGGVTPMQDVWRFPVPIPAIPPTATGVAHSADVAVFKPPQPGMDNRIGLSGLESIDGCGVAATGGQLIVSDEWHLRYWNIPSGPAALADGQPCDGFAGIDSAHALYNIYPTFGRVREDQASPQQHLWVVRNNSAGQGFLQRYDLPLTPWKSAAQTLASPVSVLGLGNISWGQIFGMTPDPSGNHLWITDTTNHRMLRVRNPLTAPVVDVILGQSALSGTSCNQGLSSPSASSLCRPGAVRLDHAGNLYVSDHALEATGNFRTLRWDASQIPAAPAACVLGIPATAVYGMGGSFTTASCNNTVGECGPWEPSFTSDDRVMAVGMNGYTGSRLPLALADPATGDHPATHLGDYGSMFFSSTFDDQDNLYMSDLDRGRVLIYLKPFSTPFPSPTPNCCAAASPWTSPSFSAAGDAAGVAVDRALGRVYVTDSNAGKVFVLGYDGSASTTFTGITGAFGVEVGACGHEGVYLANRGPGTVTKLDAAGAVQWTSAALNGGMRALHVDDAGNTYALADGGQVYVLDPSGTLRATLTGTGALGALGAPTGAFKAGLDLYVTDTVNNRIVKFTESGPGTYSYTLSQTPVVTGIGAPYGLTRDSAGRLYVTSQTLNGYYVYDSVASWNQVGSCTLSQMNGAFDVAVDETGALYVAARGSNKVVKIPPCPSWPQTTPPACPGSVTPTPTVTPTFTWTTATPTPSPTPTATPSATLTPSFTPSATPSPTPSPSVSGTPTPSPSPSASETPTPTFTPPVPSSPTLTATPTASPTPSATASWSPTVPGGTATPTPSPTPTASATPTETPTRSMTATFTPSLTDTSSPSATASMTPTTSQTPTLTPTGTAAWTDTPTPPPDAGNPPYVGDPFPNPVRYGDEVRFQYAFAGPVELKWTVFTTAFRRVEGEGRRVGGSGVLVWDLGGLKHGRFANGLYYVVFEAEGIRAVKKLMILR